MSGTRKTVAIIGAGIVGVSTALWLQRDGHDVILIDKAGPGEGTSFGNAGVLASCSIVPVTVPGLLAKAPGMLLDPRQPLFLKWGYLPRLMPWLMRYLRHANAADARRIADALFPILGDSLADHQALAAGTPAARWIVPGDYVYLYKDRAHFAKDAFGWSIRKAHGFAWDEMEGADVRAHDPAFAPELGFGVRLGNHGRIADPGRYVKDLGAHAVAEGARLVLAEATDIARENGRVTGVRAGGETIPCDAAVVAAGPWSRGLTRGLGIDVPLESERGYHLELWEPSAMPRASTMFVEGKVIFAPMDGRIRVAGMVEFGGLDAPPSPAAFALLRRFVARAMPGLQWKETKEWMGRRPAPADSIPLIGAVPGLGGAYLGFGHHHVGLTGGPKTGRLLSQIIAGRVPNIDMAPYDPARFAAGAGGRP